MKNKPMEEREQDIKAWEMWEKNFNNAKKFFESNGNIQTRSRLKDKWYKEFFLGLQEVGIALLDNQQGDER